MGCWQAISPRPPLADLLLALSDRITPQITTVAA